MTKYENNVAMYERVAKKIGLDFEYLANTPKKRTLLISNNERFCFVSTGYPGFYPNVKRQNAFFTGNKQLTQKVLQKFNYQVIATVYIKIQDYISIHELFDVLKNKDMTYPLLTKPNRGQDGNSIAISENYQQLCANVKKFYEFEKDFLIQPIVNQKEYRILVVNDEVVLMHSKRNQTVQGNGKTSIGTLLSKIPINKKSSVVIDWQHAKKKTTSESILKDGEHFEYHITKIPSTDFYYTENFPENVVAWALKLAKTISSPAVGIDVFIPNDILDTSAYTIIELNSNPAVYYLPKRCNDFTTPYQIIEKVLRNYFKLS